MQETMFTYISGVADSNWHTKYIFTISANLQKPVLSLGRSPGEGNGNTLQYSCLENPMDGGDWQATVHWVAKSRTWLSDFTFSFPSTLHSLHCCLFMLSNLGGHSLKLPGQGKKKKNSYLRCSRTVPPSSTWQQEQQVQLTIKKSRNSLHLRAKCSHLGCPTCSSLHQYWCFITIKKHFCITRVSTL